MNDRDKFGVPGEVIKSKCKFCKKDISIVFTQVKSCWMCEPEVVSIITSDGFIVKGRLIDHNARCKKYLNYLKRLRNKQVRIHGLRPIPGYCGTCKKLSFNGGKCRSVYKVRKGNCKDKINCMAVFS